MGCGGLDYRQQAQQMELRTGGMSVSTQVIPDSTQLDMYEQVSASSVYLCLEHTEAKKYISIPGPSCVQFSCGYSPESNERIVNLCLSGKWSSLIPCL